MARRRPHCSLRPTFVAALVLAAAWVGVAAVSPEEARADAPWSALEAEIRRIEKAEADALARLQAVRNKPARGRSEKERLAWRQQLEEAEYELAFRRSIRKKLVPAGGVQAEIKGTSDDAIREVLSRIESEAAAIEKAFRLDKQGGTGLHRAAEAGDAEEAARVMAQGVPAARTDREGYTALHRAAWSGAGDVVAELAKAKATLELRAPKSPVKGDPLGCTSKCCALAGPTAIHLASYAGRTAAVHHLLAAGADASAELKFQDAGAG